MDEPHNGQEGPRRLPRLWRQRDLLGCRRLIKALKLPLPLHSLPVGGIQS